MIEPDTSKQLPASWEETIPVHHLSVCACCPSQHKWVFWKAQQGSSCSCYYPIFLFKTFLVYFCWVKEKGINTILFNTSSCLLSLPCRQHYTSSWHHHCLIHLTYAPEKKKSCSEQEHNTVISFPSHTLQHLPLLAVLEKKDWEAFPICLLGNLQRRCGSGKPDQQRHMSTYMSMLEIKEFATGSSITYILPKSLKQWNLSHLLLLRNIEEHRYFQKGTPLWKVMAGTFRLYDENHWHLLCHHFPLFWNKNVMMKFPFCLALQQVNVKLPDAWSHRIIEL